jgi:hypothetical protein
VYAVLVVQLGPGIWARVDAIVRPRATFDAAGRRNDPWPVLLIAALLLGALPTGVLTAIHPVGVRPAVKASAPSI